MYVMLWPTGLSYSAFNLSVVKTEPASAALHSLSSKDTVNITVHVQNIGKKDGKTVAALYFSKPLSRFVASCKLAHRVRPTCSIS